MEIVDPHVLLSRIGTTIGPGLADRFPDNRRLGFAGGNALGGLTNALAMAYREAMAARDGAGEQRSGRDQQS